MPLVPGPWPAVVQTVGKVLTEFLAPTPNGLIGDDNATFIQKKLNVPQAETEQVIQPDSVADDLGGKAMAVVRVRWWIHTLNVIGLRPRCQTQLP
jgi:hypothetical protein